MKPWIIAAVVAGALVLVGLPAVALAIGFHPVVQTSSSEPERVYSKSEPPGAHHRMWKQHGQGWGRHGFDNGMRPGHRAFKMHKLTAKQRAALADRLDQRAGQLQKTATCLRGKSDAGTCFKRSFSPRPPRG